MIDASHANSGKRPENQIGVIDDIASQIERGEHRIIGVMVESHLVGGRQDLSRGQPLRYGQSITDGCIGWDDSVQALERLAQAVRRGRSLLPQPRADGDHARANRRRDRTVVIQESVVAW
jgi:3-deoxy-7-phosphoheptulonate synthase